MIFKNSKRHAFSEDYEVVKALGTGTFSVVKHVLHKQTGKSFAAKIISLALSSPAHIFKEVKILREVRDHPQIIQLFDVYESDDSAVVLILELVGGGELFDRIVENQSYSEADAAHLIAQVASVLEHLHRRNVIHRDIKPENLLFQDGGGQVLKLCDFGLAEKVRPNQKLNELVGSPLYVAPEVVNQTGYDVLADMYSVGVILYILLCGYPPFEPAEGITELEFCSPDWDDITASAKELIASLLDADVSKRLTAAQMLKHPWVVGAQASCRRLGQTIRTMAVFNTVRRKPGATMRAKPGPVKMSVATIFSGVVKPDHTPTRGERALVRTPEQKPHDAQPAVPAIAPILDLIQTTIDKSMDRIVARVVEAVAAHHVPLSNLNEVLLKQQVETLAKLRTALAENALLEQRLIAAETLRGRRGMRE